MTDFDLTIVELTPEKDNLHSRIRYVLLVTYSYILTDYNFQTLESSPVDEVTSIYRQIVTSVIFVLKIWKRSGLFPQSYPQKGHSKLAASR